MKKSVEVHAHHYAQRVEVHHPDDVRYTVEQALRVEALRLANNVPTRWIGTRDSETETIDQQTDRLLDIAARFEGYLLDGC